MDFNECLKGRRSIRRFKDQEVGHDVIERLVESASYSPSWKNSQTARYIVVENRDMINKIADDCVNGFKFNADTIKRSPVLVLVCYVTGRSGFEKDGSFSTSKEDRWETFDAGIATQSLSLAACAEGLGSVILGVFNEDKVAEVVGIPEGQKLAAIVPVGYPDEEPGMPKRKGVEELVSYRS